MASDWTNLSFPVGRSDDAPLRHVHQAKLLGRELAVWRADDGYLNIWENRCLHRGVRLSIGHNNGSELMCIYHGWRYANRSAGCTYIPAHPADAPARTICNRIFSASERYGLIWTSEFGEDSAPELASLQAGAPFPLRSLPFNAPAELVAEQLVNYHPPGVKPGSLLEQGLLEPGLIELGPLTAQLETESGLIVFFIQPVDSGQAVVHSVLAETPSDDQTLDVLKGHARALEGLRTHTEKLASQQPAPEPMEVALERVQPVKLDGLEPRSRSNAELRVVVKRKWETAVEVVAFELAPLSGHLPTGKPGAHIDVHLPNGLVRQYSLTNRSGQQQHYVIGVKLEPESRGGSSCLHETVREGDVLAISAPRHNFTLRRDAVSSIFIAGGIGITPLLGMAETLRSEGHDFELHHFARSAKHLAFAERSEPLGCVSHVGLDPDETGSRLEEILARYEAASHVYLCGPGPMLGAARQIASDSGWPDESIHFEYFKNSNEVDRSGQFNVSLARSGITATVNAGQTILEVLRAEGVAVASSCEQGACGTCVVGLIGGEPLHQDVYLKPSERSDGNQIVTCVSGSLSDELVLDI